MIGQLKAITVRNLKLYLRDKGAVFFSMLSMLIIIGLMVFFLGDLQVEGITGILQGFPGRDAGLDEKNVRLLVYVWTCAGIISINAVTVTLSALSPMIRDKAEGRLNSIYTAPVSRAVVAAGYVLSAWAASVIICMLTLAVTEIYGVLCGLGWFTAKIHLQLLGMITVNSFAYASFMYTAAVFMKSQGAWSGLGTIVGTLVGFLGGIYLPVGQVSSGVANVMKCTPVIYGTAMFREAMSGSILKQTFDGVPGEIIQAYKEEAGITLHVFGRNMALWQDCLLILLFGAIFFMMGIAMLKCQKRSDR